MTTTITIDYYEELKRKADIYDNAKVFIDSIGLWNEVILTNRNSINPVPVISLEQFQNLKRKADELDENQRIILLSKEREQDYKKLEKILAILNNHMYFDSPTKRNYYNLVHEVASTINSNYDLCNDFGKTYIDESKL